MSPLARLCLIRLLIAAFVVTSGLNSYFAIAAHGEHMGIGHVHDTTSGHYAHDHRHGDSGWSYIALCESEAACDDEPGSATFHIHVNCTGPVAVTPGEVTVKYVAVHATIGVDQGSRSPIVQMIYPLLRPPRATV